MLSMWSIDCLARQTFKCALQAERSGGAQQRVQHMMMMMMMMLIRAWSMMQAFGFGTHDFHSAVYS